jgi:hypothetical protein
MYDVFFFSQFNPKPNITSRREDEEKTNTKWVEQLTIRVNMNFPPI